MKIPIALPLFVGGLLLAGCASRTHSDRVSADQSNPHLPPIATDQTAEARAETIRRVDAEMQGASQPPSRLAADAPLAPPSAAANSATVAANFPSPEPAKPATMTIPASTQTLSPAPVAPTPTEVAPAITDASLPLSERIIQWKLAPGDIKAELENSGRVLRLKTPAPGEPTGPLDSTLLNQINAKLKDDSGTSSLSLKVDVDMGVVTLNGSAPSLEQIGRAIALALDTGGVTQIISLIKLDAAPSP